MCITIILHDWSGPVGLLKVHKNNKLFFQDQSFIDYHLVNKDIMAVLFLTIICLEKVALLFAFKKFCQVIIQCSGQEIFFKTLKLK